MIFVIGSQPVIKKFLSRENKYCFRCQNTTQWIIEKQQQYLSLFFIPTVSLNTKYHTFCPICHNSKALSKSEYEQSIKQASPFNEP